MKLRAIRDHIIVSDMKFKERLSNGGIVILSDDSTSSGIRPRWAKVHAVGKECTDIKAGQYVLISHGRWTRGIKHEDEVIRRVDNNDILAVSDVPMNDESGAGSDVVTDQNRRELPA
jgi:co-chaperonin GroES (HSP10)